MAMRARIAHLTHRPAAVRRGPALRLATALGEPPDPEARVREAGGPEDRASYRCGCGYIFRAAVSTSVACPHCGTGQAW